MNYRRERWSTEVDLPARRREEARSAGFTVGPFWGVRFLGDVSDLQTTFDADQILYGVDLRQTLSERVQSAVAGVQFSVTSNTALTLSGGRATHRFVLLPDRDANSSELSADLSFKTGAAISGEALVKWVQYVPLDRTVDAYDGPAGRISLSRSFWSRTAIGGLAERATGSSFAPQFAFSVIDRTGGWIQQVLSRRFDVVVEAFRERYLNRAFRTTPAGVRGAPLVWADSDGRRYTAQLGLRVGPARVASHLSATERVNPAAFQGVVFWVDVSYGVFQVRSR